MSIDSEPSKLLCPLHLQHPRACEYRSGLNTCLDCLQCVLSEWLNVAREYVELTCWC